MKLNAIVQPSFQMPTVVYLHNSLHIYVYIYHGYAVYSAHIYVPQTSNGWVYAE